MNTEWMNRMNEWIQNEYRMNTEWIQNEWIQNTELEWIQNLKFKVLDIILQKKIQLFSY